MKTWLKISILIVIAIFGIQCLQTVHASADKPLVAHYSLPAVPTNLQLNPEHTASGTLSWNDNSSNETRFEIWRVVTAPPARQELYATLASNTTSYQVNAPTPYTTYYTIYTVKACNSEGCTTSSGLSTYWLPNPPTPTRTSTPTRTPTPTRTSTPAGLYGSFTYNPGKWNYQPVQTNNNCYNYAIDSVRTSWTYLDAGETFDVNIIGTINPDPYAGYTDTWKHITALNWYKAARNKGFIFVGLNLSAAQSGTRLVAIGGRIWYQEFHFVRLDSNGYWSHKAGDTAATNKDANGQLITDPISVLGSLDFIGYFLAP